MTDSTPSASSASSTLRIVLVDDQRLVRSGFELMLSVEDDIEIVGQAADGQEALEVVARTRPDVVLMDVQMPRMDGIEATRRIVSGGSGGARAPRVVILTTFDRDDYVFAGLRAGASGFLLKNCEPDQLVDAIRAAGHGHAVGMVPVPRWWCGGGSQHLCGSAEPGECAAGQHHDDAESYHQQHRWQHAELEHRRGKHLHVGANCDFTG